VLAEFSNVYLTVWIGLGLPALSAESGPLFWAVRNISISELHGSQATKVLCNLMAAAQLSAMDQRSRFRSRGISGWGQNTPRNGFCLAKTISKARCPGDRYNAGNAKQQLARSPSTLNNVLKSRLLLNWSRSQLNGGNK
jgi:hypothetical protein